MQSVIQINSIWEYFLNEKSSNEPKISLHLKLKLSQKEQEITSECPKEGADLT